MRLVVALTARQNSGHARQPGDVVGVLPEGRDLGVAGARFLRIVEVPDDQVGDLDSLLLSTDSHNRAYGFDVTKIPAIKKPVYDENGQQIGEQDDLQAPVVLADLDAALDDRGNPNPPVNRSKRVAWARNRRSEISRLEERGRERADKIQAMLDARHTGVQRVTFNDGTHEDVDITPPPGPLYVAIVPREPRVENDVEIPQNGVVIRRRSSPDAIEEWSGLHPEDAMSAELAIIDQHGGKVWDA